MVRQRLQHDIIHISIVCSAIVNHGFILIRTIFSTVLVLILINYIQKYMAKSKIHREDGLLSAQMLNGIPEVDLGINTKLSNIERTEAAKRIMGMCSTSYFAFLVFTHLLIFYQ